MHLYGKEDLARLKDSKPIQITAHTHECIVPVVYSGMVNRFLESKGIQLPLTHHHLAEMKHEAGVSGYAVGSKGLKKKKPKKAKKKEEKLKAPLINQSVNVTVTSGSKSSSSASGGGGSGSGGAGGKGMGGAGGRGGGGGGTGGGGGGGDKARALYNQLRPNNYAMIRSVSLAPQQIHPIIDYGKEAREAKAKESEALEHYKKEIETRTKQLERLEATMADVLKAKEPLQKSEAATPLKRNDFDQAGQESLSRAAGEKYLKAQEAFLKNKTEAEKAYYEERARVKKQQDAEEAKRRLVGKIHEAPIKIAQPVSALPAVSEPPAQPAQPAPPAKKKRGRPNKQKNQAQQP